MNNEEVKIPNWPTLNRKPNQNISPVETPLNRLQIDKRFPDWHHRVTEAKVLASDNNTSKIKLQKYQFDEVIARIKEEISYTFGPESVEEIFDNLDKYAAGVLQRG